MYLFGSQLAKKLFPDFRNPKDTDWVTNNFVEYYNSISQKTKENEIYLIPCSPNREMTADELYTLKVSHAIYDINWTKTMSDIRFFQIKGCKIIKPFLIDLRTHWENIHKLKQQRTNFDIEEDIFFKDNVKRNIDHDELHKVFNINPSYKTVVDGVKPIESKFFRLSDQIKDDICFEEAWVIAIERFYDKFPYMKAYNMAQQALVTRLHPIWIADYIIENWNNKFWTNKTNYYDVYEESINRKG